MFKRLSAFFDYGQYLCTPLNYLRLQKFSVALIEPVFDNLADILKRHSIPLLPLDETSFGEMSPYDVVKNTKANAIFLAIPNNPTGQIFTDTEFEQIVEACKVTGKILIVDFCFRFFAPTMFNWDQYEILDNSGIDYLAIEDTGKTWPTFELKVSTLTTSSNLFNQLHRIYRDLYICQPPFILLVVNNFIENTIETGIDTIRRVPQTNRSKLTAALSNSPLVPVSTPTTNVEWLKIENEMSDMVLHTHLKQSNIHVLPGNRFFWSQETDNSKFIRVALMRDTQIFSEAMERLASCIANLMG